MKKFITLLFAVSIFTASFAQFFEKGQILFIPFNDGSGADLSVHNLELQLIVTNSTNDRYGVQKAAITLDGVTSYAKLKLEQPDEALTIAVWVKPKIEKSNGYIVGWSEESGISIEIDGKRFIVKHNGNKELDYKVDIEENRWYHLIVTLKNNDIRLYIDSKEVDDKIIEYEQNNKNINFFVGSNNRINYFKGKIDDIVIYNRALNKDEVSLLFFNQINQEFVTSNFRFFSESDVDTDIPETKKKRTDTYVLAFGNEDYEKYSQGRSGIENTNNVDYANNDAHKFSLYMEKTLGIDKNNITTIYDATAGQMQQSIEKFISLVKTAQEQERNPKIIFYYSGHGYLDPADSSRRPYLVPTDMSVTSTNNLVDISKLYKDLSETESEQIIVMLDACYTTMDIRPGIKMKKARSSKNLVAFNASSTNNPSTPYKEMHHGFFTYYILKKLQEDKNITLGDLSDYLNQEVAFNSQKINSFSQIPVTHSSIDIKTKWEKWKF